MEKDEQVLGASASADRATHEPSPSVSAVPVSVPSAAECRRLLELRQKASSGDWYVSRGGFGDSLWFTTHWREMDIGKDGREGPIGNISTKRRVYRERSRLSGERTSYEVEHKHAVADADYLVAAVNIVPRLIAALLGPGQIDETGWLIEFPADKYGPVRYLAIGEPNVIDASDATRFSRKIDAEKYVRAHGVKGHKIAEHAWTGIDPAQAIDARSGETEGLDPEGTKARSEGCAQSQDASS